MCPMSLVIRQMQIEMTVLDDFTLSTMTKTKKIGNPRSRQGYRLLVSYCSCKKLPHTQWLKQHNLFIYTSGGQKSQNRGVGQVVILLDALQGNVFPCLCQLLNAICIPWFMESFSIFKASNDITSFSLSLPSVSASIITFPSMTLTLLSPYCKNTGIILDPPNNLG